MDIVLKKKEIDIVGWMIEVIENNEDNKGCKLICSNDYVKW